MTLPKVVIGVPYYRVVEGTMFLSSLGLAFYSAPHIQVLPIDCSGGYIESNRNGIVEYALEIEGSSDIRFDWLFFIDTDMMFPHDALMRLIEHDKDIVGANYRTRTPPFGFAGHYLDGTDNHVYSDDLEPMAHLPTGLLLIRFDVFRKILEHETERAERRMIEFPEAIEYLRAHGKSELAIEELSERVNPFPDSWFRAPRNRADKRDDVYFCHLARKLGYEIWCDQQLTKQVFHRTVQDLGWFNEKQIVYEGAALNINKAKMDGDRRARETARYLSDQAAD